MRVGIVGGGIAGLTLGYLLARSGTAVDIFEASPDLGGLAGPLVLPDGTSVDRFYHAILPSDDHLHELCRDLAIEDQLRFRRTRNAFFVNGVTATMNSTAEFMQFTPLTLLERFRLGLTVLRAQLVRDWHPLEQVSVHSWLRRWSGSGVYGKLWGPMLTAKFERADDTIPATWMWSRLVRMKSTRSGANQQEAAGHLVGGYSTLLSAMATRIEQSGGRIHVRCPVEEILLERGRAVGLRTTQGMIWQGGPIVCTMQAPVFRRLLRDGPPDYLQALTAVEYLGVVCPLVVLDRPFLGYWVLNVADSAVPFTGLIETTAYIDPAYVGGHHLLYLPKYTRPGSPWQTMDDHCVRQEVISALSKVNPAFDARSIQYLLVHRERYVEPLRRVGATDTVPGIDTPIADLYLATTAQIYPALTHGESVTRHARSVADLLAPRLRPVPVQFRQLQTAATS